MTIFAKKLKIKNMYSKYTSYQEQKELDERYAGIELPKLSSEEKYITVDELRNKLRKMVHDCYHT